MVLLVGFIHVLACGVEEMGRMFMECWLKFCFQPVEFGRRVACWYYLSLAREKINWIKLIFFLLKFFLC